MKTINIIILSWLVVSMGLQAKQVIDKKFGFTLNLPKQPQKLEFKHAMGDAVSYTAVDESKEIAYLTSVIKIAALNDTKDDDVKKLVKTHFDAYCKDLGSKNIKSNWVKGTQFPVIHFSCTDYGVIAEGITSYKRGYLFLSQGMFVKLSVVGFEITKDLKAPSLALFSSFMFLDQKTIKKISGGDTPPSNKQPMPQIDGNDMKGWKHVSMPDTSSFNIPPSMEIQAGLYKAISNKHMNTIFKGMEGFEIIKSKDRVVIQQAGLNKYDEQARTLYCRLIVETIHGESGEFADLDDALTVTREDLRSINQEFKKQFLRETATIEKRGAMVVKVIDWFPPTVVEIGGVSVPKISYTRKIFSKAKGAFNPPVMVSVYLVSNNDRVHRITASYRIKEKSKWESDLAKSIKTFSFKKK